MGNETWEPVEPLADTLERYVDWAPWTPKVGDRVRVRLSGECQQFHLGNAHINASYTILDAIVDGTLGGEGFMGANGAEGVIEAICPSEGEDDGHPYLVSDSVNGHWNRVDDFFALSELEPLR